MSQAADDGFMGGGGAKSFKFDRPGDQIQGRVVLVEKVQQTDYGTGKLKFWDDGKPRWQWNITLQTDLRDDASDDGQRRIYAKGDLHKKIIQAVKKSGHTNGGSIVGGVLGVRFHKLGEAKRGQSAPKLYATQYTPPADDDAGFDTGDDDAADSSSGGNDEDIPF